MWSLYESGLFPQDLIHLTYGKALICLNPFENQVYFHRGNAQRGFDISDTTS